MDWLLSDWKQATTRDGVRVLSWQSGQTAYIATLNGLANRAGVLDRIPTVVMLDE